MLIRKPWINVLSVSPFEKDHEFLRSIVNRPNWRLLCAADCREAWSLLHQSSFTAVITERKFPGGISWRELLDEVANMQDGPPVIISTRAADNDFWTESIRAGAFDILVKPFDPDEVRRAISMAWQQSRDAQLLKRGAGFRIGNAAVARA